MRGPTGIAGVSAVALVGAMILSACAAQAGTLNRGSENRSQDQVERTPSRVGPAATVDTSYDQVERSRSLTGAAATPDTSYDQVERSRSLTGAAATPDTSYDQVERARGAAFGR
jgi:hypothetical protein